MAEAPSVIKDPRSTSDQGRAIPLLSLTCAALLATPGGLAALAQAAEPPIRLTAAGQHGTFTVGAGRAVASRTPDAGGEVVKLDYTLPRGTTAGVWAKAFPEGLNA